MGMLMEAPVILEPRWQKQDFKVAFREKGD
jgi:hypothetical protein